MLGNEHLVLSTVCGYSGKTNGYWIRHRYLVVQHDNKIVTVRRNIFIYVSPLYPTLPVRGFIKKCEAYQRSRFVVNILHVLHIYHYPKQNASYDIFPPVMRKVH